jgi:parvulin-like peptidyl-prolyl isomerase
MILKDFSLLPEDVLYEIKLSGRIYAATEALISEKIVSQIAAELKIEVEEEEIKKEADKIRLANRIYKPEETWIWLKKQGLSLEDFKRIARRNILANKLAKSLFGDQVKDYFIANKLSYHAATIYEILFDDLDLATEIYQAVLDKQLDFSQAAKEYSQDIHAKRSGGYKGTLKYQQLKPEFAAAIFGSHAPQLLKPLVTSKGAHLIYVEEIIIPELDGVLEKKIIIDLFNAWMKKQLMEVDIIQLIKNL